MMDGKAPLKCPECLEAGVEHVPFKGPQGLGSHRARMHGVHGDGFRPGNVDKPARSQPRMVPVRSDDPFDMRINIAPSGMNVQVGPMTFYDVGKFNEWADRVARIKEAIRVQLGFAAGAQQKEEMRRG